MYAGEKRLLYLLYNGVYLPIGCLLSNNIEENTDFIETTTRLSDGWRKYKPTFQGTNISFDFEVHELNAIDKIGYITLKGYKREQRLCNLKIANIDGSNEELYTGYIESVTDTAASGEVWNISINFKTVPNV